MAQCAHLRTAFPLPGTAALLEGGDRLRGDAAAQGQDRPPVGGAGLDRTASDQADLPPRVTDRPPGGVLVPATGPRSAVGLRRLDTWGGVGLEACRRPGTARRPGGRRAARR